MTEPTELVEQIARKAAAHFDLMCRGGQPIETLADLSSAEMDVGSVDCLLFARAIIPLVRAHDAARVAELEAENASLRKEWADLHNQANIVGSPYDQALRAVDAIVTDMRARACRALGGNNAG